MSPFTAAPQSSLALPAAACALAATLPVVLLPNFPVVVLALLLVPLLSAGAEVLVPRAAWLATVVLPLRMVEAAVPVVAFDELRAVVEVATLVACAPCVGPLLDLSLLPRRPRAVVWAAALEDVVVGFEECEAVRALLRELVLLLPMWVLLPVVVDALAPLPASSLPLLRPLGSQGAGHILVST